MQDQTGKRRNLAANAVVQATRLVDALQALQALRDERASAGNFVDADFDGTAGGLDLTHLTPGMVGTLLDLVVPDLLAAYADQGNGGRAKQILLQCRR